ncbi:MAG: PAS domain S-box protein, partial [Candidatus Thermoplasmatota archaeon]
ERKRYENPILTKDGEERIISWRNTVLRNDDGEIIAILSSGMDITERKKTKERLESFVDAIPDLVVVYDREGYYEEILTSQHELLYGSREQLLGKRIDEVMPEDLGARMLDFVQRTIESDEVQKIEYPLTLEGEKHWFEARALPIKSEKKDSERIVSVIRDITVRKRMEEELQERRERLERVVEEAPFPIMLHAEDGEVVKINQVWIEITGYDAEEIPTISDWTEKAHHKKKREMEKLIESLHEKEGRTSEGKFEISTKNGEERIWDFMSTKVGELPDGRSLVLSMAQDITERQKVKKELEESEEKYRTITEQSHDAIYIYSGDEFLFVNDRTSEITGYSKDELYSMNIWDLLHPDDREKVREIGRKRSQGEESPSQYEARIITKDGETRYCEFSVSRITYKERYAAIGSVRDVTDRRKTEERRNFLNTLLKQDLRSKYQTIQGFLQLIEGKDLTEEQREYLRKAIETGREANEILGLERQLEEIEEIEWTTEKDIVKVLKHVFADISSLVEREGGQIEKNYPEKIPKVKGDYSLKTLLSQILVTRIQSSNCDNIRIDAKEREEDILLSIEDDGKQLLEEIKNLFSGDVYTGETTGIGGVRYYMLKEIAEHNDCRIEVKDSDMGGARFDVRLKKAEG